MNDLPLAPIFVPATSTSDRSCLATVLSDDRAVASLIDQILSRSGMTQAEVCRRLGIRQSNFNQYRLGRRNKPSLWWICRLVDVTGCKLLVEFPARPL